jgi:hypothetical protein
LVAIKQQPIDGDHDRIAWKCWHHASSPHTKLKNPSRVTSKKFKKEIFPTVIVQIFFDFFHFDLQME